MHSRSIQSHGVTIYMTSNLFHLFYTGPFVVNVIIAIFNIVYFLVNIFIDSNEHSNIVT